MSGLPNLAWETPWRLWRGATPYTLIVFEDVRSGQWDVEIYVEHPNHGDSDTPDLHLETVTLHRNTHIVGDMIPHVERALEERRRDELDGLVKRRALT